jgi:WD40 repeat protein
LVGVVFGPDCADLSDAYAERCGTLVATASFDGTAKLWDASTGQELLTLSAHSGPVISISFSPDGTRLATGSLDGTVRVYTLLLDELVALAQERVTRSLTDEECQRFLHLDQCP